MIDLRMSKLPAATRGKVATEKRIAVADNGQVRFNSLASEFLAKNAKNPDEVVVYFLLDDDRNLLIDTKPYTKKEFPELAESYTPDDGKALSFNGDLVKEKKQHLYYVSIANLLNAAGYDYRNSGAQSFGLVSGKTSTRLSFKLPEGSLTPKPIQPRKKREKSVSVPQATEPELVEA